MASRLDLHEILCSILGTRNVYFQPPATIKMTYPAIVYSLSNVENVHADDIAYDQRYSYEVIVIDKDPDNMVMKHVSALPYCRFNRYYTADNLNHYAFTLYF